jgi:hypothetical protein
MRAIDEFKYDCNPHIFTFTAGKGPRTKQPAAAQEEEAARRRRKKRQARYQNNKKSEGTQPQYTSHVLEFICIILACLKFHSLILVSCMVFLFQL